MIKNLAILLLSLLFFSSCETEFDINDDYKDITIVYGLLNPQEKIHYIKINKAFLGDAKAIDMAKYADSSSYADDIDVNIEEWNNGNLIRSFHLTKIIITDKESGDFYSPEQEVYTFQADLNVDSKYKLNIWNTKLNKFVTAETNLIKELYFENLTSIEQNPKASRVFYDNDNLLRVKWKSIENGKRYQLVIRIHYSEFDKSTNTLLKKDYIHWKQNTLKSRSSVGNENMEIKYKGSDFYNIIAANLDINPDIYRKCDTVDYILSVADEIFDTYLEICGPNNSIIENRIEYTNISNGIGIFSCRSFVKATFLVREDTRNELRENSKTSNLGFLHFSNY